MTQELLQQGSERILSQYLLKAFYLCWAEDIGDGVARKIFVLDWTPQIHNFLLSNIDTQLSTEIHKLRDEIHPPCLPPGSEILLKFLLDAFIA